MEKACEAYVTIVLTKGFNITVYKKASVYFIVTYSHETSQYLSRISL